MEMLEGYEAKIIQKTLRKNKGNKTKTAKELGVSIRNLYYKMEKFYLE
jgi:transcriptional regulator with PAS, ATPase and Fis domain